MKTGNILKLAASIIICLSAGFIGSIFTMDSISTWYMEIEKPFFNPPNWVFAPVWTTLYILMGISLYIVWKNGIEKEGVKIALTLFGVQIVLNTLWSILFFGMKSPLYAFVEIIILWAAILLTIIKFMKISKTAGYLLVPYILWVSFAAVLNFSIFILNS
ncbi:TspO protein [Candidatus Altiarchaeales archaeon WOR_SM1_SCG]|nr:TspO protein [Candidatus Altiarchaeales archaeon WOR_SM1_SCG]